MARVRIVAVLIGLIFSTAARAVNSGAGEWTTFGNDPTHSGYYPKTIGSAPFVANWTKTFSTRVNQVAVSGESIYATTNGYFDSGMRAFALSVADGSEKWSFPLADAYSVNPPTYSQGRVYFQRGNHSGDTHLWCLDATSGTLQFAAPHGAQWERYAAPTVADGGAFVNGGSYGGMYGFDANTGAQRFFVNNLAQVSGWTPSYWNGAVYSCTNGIFTAHDPQTGAQLWSRNLRETNGGYWSAGTIPVISGGKAAIIAENRIVVIDLETRTQLWTKSGYYLGTPAFADGKVYAFLESEVKAYDGADGTLLGTYTGMGNERLLNQPMVTKDLLLVSTPSRTLIFDRASFALRQTLSAGGNLSYASGRLYVVSDEWGKPAEMASFTVDAEESDPPAEPPPSPRPPQPKPNPERPLGLTSTAWVDSMEAGGIVLLSLRRARKDRALRSGDWQLAPPDLTSRRSDGLHCCRHWDLRELWEVDLEVSARWSH